MNALLEIIILLAVPATLTVCALVQIDQSALLSLMVVLASLILFFIHWENEKPSLKQIMPTAVLAALAAAGRILFAPIPDFKPVSAICIMAGALFGRHSGFMVGALAALISNFFFGQGPWTPWQMYAWGLVGYCAGALAHTGLLEKKPVLYAYAFLSGLGYGFILNCWSVVGFLHPITLPGALALFASALPFDCVHGVATVIFLAVLYSPWKRKLERIKTKYALAEHASKS